MTNFHICLVTILCTTLLSIPYSLANAEALPFTCLSLISLTCTSVSFAWPCASPFAPQLCLFFAMQSLQLSPLVPSHKWSGFTHAFTSHLCSTQRPSGMGPLNSNQLYLWAKYCTWLTLRCPYPLGIFPAAQIQHESALFTFCRNLSFGVMHVIMQSLGCKSSSLCMSR